jgi:hypothetical protein
MYSVLFINTRFPFKNVQQIQNPHTKTILVETEILGPLAVSWPSHGSHCPAELQFERWTREAVQQSTAMVELVLPYK